MTPIEIPEKKTFLDIGLNNFGQSPIQFLGSGINKSAQGMFDASVPSNFIQDGDIITRLNVVDGYLQSEGFVTGSKGWRIDSDGNAEFETGYFRGDITGASGAFSGSLEVGTDAWHVDTDGNMWWGSSSTYIGATIKISAAGSVDLTTGTFSGALSANTGTLGALTIASGGNIKFGKTAYSDDTHAGFWLGDDSGTAKFNIGSSSSKYLHYDGTDLSILGGTITGATIQTAVSGYRIRLTSAADIQFLNGVTQKGGIRADTGDTMVYTSTENHTFFSDGDYAFQVNTNGITIAEDKYLGFQSGQKITDVSGYLLSNVAWRVDGACYPDSDNDYTLGASDKRWSNAYFDNGFCDNITVDEKISGGADLDIGGSKDFKIDHPLKPETHWLRHSCIESPERFLMYKGRGEIKDGKAIINLPNYFEVLNKDFDYNLTPIGQQMSLWISKEIKNNKFEVSADVDGNFTWIVYGIRNDVYCKKNKFIVEEEKEEVGYRHPELFGKNKTEGFKYKRLQKAKIEEDKAIEYQINKSKKDKFPEK